MKKRNFIVVTITVIAIAGWAMYLYYDFVQVKKEAVIELTQLNKEAMAEMRKPKGHLGFENRGTKYAEIRITNSNSDLIRWVTLNSGFSGSYGEYDAGEIKLELMRDEKVIHAVVIDLRKGGDVTFDVRENQLQTR